MEVHQTLKVQVAPLTVFTRRSLSCHKGSHQPRPAAIRRPPPGLPRGKARTTGCRSLPILRERTRPLVPLTSMKGTRWQVRDKLPEANRAVDLLRPAATARPLRVAQWEEGAFVVTVRRRAPGENHQRAHALLAGNLTATGGPHLRRFAGRYPGRGSRSQAPGTSRAEAA